MLVALDAPLKKARIQVQGAPECLHHSCREWPFLLCHIQAHLDPFSTLFVQEPFQYSVIVYIWPWSELVFSCDIQYRDDKLLVLNVRPHVIVQKPEAVPSCLHQFVDILMIGFPVRFRRLLPSLIWLQRILCGLPRVA